MVLVGGLLCQPNVLRADPISDFKQAYQSGDYTRSFDVLARLKRISNNPDVFGKLLGVSAYRLEAYLYAMYLFESYYQKVQKSSEVMGNLMVSARQVTMESYVARAHYEDLMGYSVLPNYVRAAIAPEVVLESFEREDVGRAYDYLPFLRASRKGLYVGGVFATLNNTPDVAIKYFERVVAQPINHPRDYHIHLMTQLALGRLYYEMGQWDKSIEHFNRVPRSSKLWFDALFESSWAHFQNGELNLALGKLHSFISPFLLNRMYPEALVLRTMVLFELCKYAEMASTLGYFYQVYRSMLSQMPELIKRFDDMNAVKLQAGQVLMGQGSSTLFDGLPEPLRLHYHHHQKTYEYRQRIAFIEENTDKSMNLAYRMGDPGNREATSLKSYITNLKAFVVEDYAQWMKSEISHVAHLIQQRVDQASLVEIEMTLGEQEAVDKIEQIIEQARSSGRILAITGPGHEFWPFYNEFWKDEIGYYVINSPSSCVDVQ